MSVEVTSGNIFEADVECITDANNSIGVAGAGLALAFSKRYPKAAEEYNLFSKLWQKANNPGGNFTLLPPVIIPKGYWDNHDYAICKFPSMIYPGEITKVENIATNLKLLKELLDRKNIYSIALPALGCGIGRLEFQKLEKLVRETFENERRFRCLLYRPG